MLTSYAQNFEDVILWRALKHVDRGFYIDIGACDPVVDSVSLAFYEKGWRGAHVEPVAAYAEKLRQARPDETVIQAAIGTSAGSIPFWEFSEGLSTGDPTVAAMHERGNRKSVRVEVPCMRMSRLLSDYCDRDIHWLKIDVEGMEGSVIRSWQPASARPWIVLIESTVPNCQEPTFANWESFLVSLGYEFVYFDGINRFYVSREHLELKKHFGPGPNYFDGFALSGSASAPFCAWINAESANLREQARARAEQAAARAEEAAYLSSRVEKLLTQAALRDKTIEGLSSRVKSLEADVLARNAELGAIKASKSWRMTAPLHSANATARRFLHSPWAWRITGPLRSSRMARWFLQGSWAWLTLNPGCRPRRMVRWFLLGSRAWLTLKPGCRPRRIARRGTVAAARFLLAWPRLAQPARYLLRQFPTIEGRLRMMLRHGDVSRRPAHNFVPHNHNPNVESRPDLSRYAHRVYAELKSAIAAHRGSR